MSTPPSTELTDVKSTRPNRMMLSEVFGANQNAVRFLENMAIDIVQTLPGNITIVQETVEANLQMVLMLTQSLQRVPAGHSAAARMAQESVAVAPRQCADMSALRAESLVPIARAAPSAPMALADVPVYRGEGALVSRVQMEVSTFTAQPPGNYQLA